MTAIARKWCPRCNQHVPASGGANHVLHLVLSLVTLGMWLPIWLLSAMLPAYNCTKCGSQTGLSVRWAWAAGLLFGGVILWSILNR